MSFFDQQISKFVSTGRLVKYKNLNDDIKKNILQCSESQLIDRKFIIDLNKYNILNNLEQPNIITELDELGFPEHSYKFNYVSNTQRETGYYNLSLFINVKPSNENTFYAEQYKRFNPEDIPYKYYKLREDIKCEIIKSDGKNNKFIFNLRDNYNIRSNEIENINKIMKSIGFKESNYNFDFFDGNQKDPYPYLILNIIMH